MCQQVVGIQWRFVAHLEVDSETAGLIRARAAAEDRTIRAIVKRAVLSYAQAAEVADTEGASGEQG